MEDSALPPPPVTQTVEETDQDEFSLTRLAELMGQAISNNLNSPATQGEVDDDSHL